MSHLLVTSLLDIQTSTDVIVFLRYLVVSSSMLCRLWGVQDKNANKMMIPTLYS